VNVGVREGRGRAPAKGRWKNRRKDGVPRGAFGAEGETEEDAGALRRRGMIAATPMRTRVRQLSARLRQRDYAAGRGRLLGAGKPTKERSNPLGPVVVGGRPTRFVNVWREDMH
jgi:hypothetical protein